MKGNIWIFSTNLLPSKWIFINVIIIINAERRVEEEVGLGVLEVQRELHRVDVVREHRDRNVRSRWLAMRPALPPLTPWLEGRPHGRMMPCMNRLRLGLGGTGAAGEESLCRCEMMPLPS